MESSFTRRNSRDAIMRDVQDATSASSRYLVETRI